MVNGRVETVRRRKRRGKRYAWERTQGKAEGVHDARSEESEVESLAERLASARHTLAEVRQLLATVPESQKSHLARRLQQLHGNAFVALLVPQREVHGALGLHLRCAAEAPTLNVRTALTALHGKGLRLPQVAFEALQQTPEKGVAQLEAALLRTLPDALRAWARECAEWLLRWLSANSHTAVLLPELPDAGDTAQAFDAAFPQPGVGIELSGNLRDLSQQAPKGIALTLYFP